VVRVPIAFLLGLFVFVAAGILSQSVGSIIPESVASKAWWTTTLFQLLMAVISVLLMLLIGRGDLSRFGFKLGSRPPYWRIVLLVLAAQVLCTAVFLPCPRTGPEHFASEFSFLRIVIGVWIIASACEEVVARGLVQGFLSPLHERGITIAGVRLGLPAIVGALFFSATHLPLLMMGIDRCLGLQILVGTFLLGLIAGHFRERTGSLLPAVAAHALANVFGMALDTVTTRFIDL
jgi:membrane protease YdiL (CAAX protease family)